MTHVDGYYIGEYMRRYHNDFIKALVEKDYQKTYNIVQNSEYDFFYQYQAWNEYSIDNIQKGRIVLSNILDFNDPYDLFYKYSVEKIYKGYVPLDVKKEAMEKIRERHLQEMESIHKNVFASCFSSVNDSVLMWGHYAVKHTGYCVEYNKGDLIDICKVNNALFGEIDYSTKVIEIKSKGDYRYELNKANFTKFIDWQYEKEWRMLAIDSKHCRVTEVKNTYGKIFLEGIFPSKILLGCKMCDGNKQKIIEICKNLGISCVETRMDYDRYKIVERN